MSGNDPKIIHVVMSDMKAAGNDYVLHSSGIGSCIAITLYDPVKRVGALAHPMLPVLDVRHTSLRFVEPAIDAMINTLKTLGGVKSRAQAKIVGGAHMFSVFDEQEESIGLQNAQAAKHKLEKEGIVIIANDTGGNVGRSVTFDLKTGLLEVKTKI
jgi:chemotaxis protein CheD